MTELLQATICRTCHGAGYVWSYELQLQVTCSVCKGTGNFHRPQYEVLNESNAALINERDRAISIIMSMLVDIKDNKDMYDRYMGIMIDLNNDIYEREHPDVEVPW